MRRILKPAAALALLAGLLMTIGCGGKKPQLEIYSEEIPNAVAKAADEVVSDPERAQALKDQAVALSYSLQAYAEENWNLRLQAFYMNQNYEASKEEGDQFMADLAKVRDKKQREVIDIMVRSRELLTEDEWVAYKAAVVRHMEDD